MTENITIKSYEEFKEQLLKVEKDVDIVLSFYKYCYRHDNRFEHFKKMILEELEPMGLVPYKVNNNMDLFFNYENQAEAIIYIKPYGIDLILHRL